jgi:hypothetical protein
MGITEQVDRSIDTPVSDRERREFNVKITLSVRDIGLLWRMAAAHALAISGLEQEDVEEVIGPLDDPSITECLAMLLVPGPMAGCALTDFSVEPVTRITRRKSVKVKRPRISPFAHMGENSVLLR